MFMGFLLESVRIATFKALSHQNVAKINKFFRACSNYINSIQDNKNCWNC